MKTLNNPEIQAQMEDFILNRASGTYSFILAMEEDDGSITLHERHHQPCWGEMRVYNRTLDNHSKPSDLTNPFPKTGKPVAIACKMVPTEHKEKAEWIFSNESPWAKNGFGSEGATIIRDKTGTMKGVMILDTHMDPTVLVNALKNSTYWGYTPWKQLVDAGVDKDIAFLIVNALTRGNEFNGDGYYTNSYCFGGKVSMKRWANHNPRNLCITAPLYIDRAAYNRPKMQDIFSDDDAINIVDLAPHKGVLTLAEILETVVPKLKELLGR